MLTRGCLEVPVIFFLAQHFYFDYLCPLTLAYLYIVTVMLTKVASASIESRPRCLVRRHTSLPLSHLLPWNSGGSGMCAVIRGKSFRPGARRHGLFSKGSAGYVLRG